MDFVKDLKEAQELKRTIEIYTDRDNMESFCFGFINSIDEEYVYINDITQDGEEDGMTVRRLSDIYRVEYGGYYEIRLEKLYRIKKQSHEEFPSYDSFDKFLKAMKLSKSIVTISIGTYDNNIEASGIIENIDGEKIYLLELSGIAHRRSIIVLDKKDIYSISYGSKTEKNIQLLLDNPS